MSKYSLFKKVCKQIVYAQCASDEAKNIYGPRLTNKEYIKELEKLSRNRCYDHKDNHILNAVTILDNNRPFGINYYLVHDVDQNGYACSIIYFEIKMEDGKRLQISFHSFSDNLDKRMEGKKKRRKGRITKWDHKDSRRNCQYLVDYFGF